MPPPESGREIVLKSFYRLKSRKKKFWLQLIKLFHFDNFSTFFLNIFFSQKEVLKLTLSCEKFGFDVLAFADVKKLH